MKTKDLEQKIGRVQAELKDIDARKDDLVAESSALQAALPQLAFASEKDAAAKSALRANQDRQAEISIGLVGLDYRRDELERLRVVLGAEFAAVRRDEAKVALAKANQERAGLEEEFRVGIIAARVLLEKLAAKAGEVDALERTVAQIEGAPADVGRHLWNQYRVSLGAFVRETFRMGPHRLALETSRDVEQRTAAVKMLNRAGIDLTPGQVQPSD